MKRRTRRLVRLSAVVVALAAIGTAFLVWRQPGNRPHVIVITVESLRTDHVRCLGGERATTPSLDALAGESVIYEDAHSVTSWTLASHASIFTGLYPSAHQTTGPVDRLDHSYETMAEVLRKRGYQTAGVISGPYLRRNHQLDQGFEHYDDSPSSVNHSQAHSAVTNQAMHRGLLKFLDGERDERPLFLFAYYWDPHYDFLPPAPFDQTFVEEGHEPVDVRGFGTNQNVHPGIRPAQLDYVLSQYDGEILWTDGYLGQLFAALEERGLWDDALVIVTADHGEEFFDHGKKGHKNNIYAETVHVPLIVKYPGGQDAGTRDGRLVSHVDLLPTILDLTASDFESPLHGHSLLEEEPRPDRSIHYELLETWYTRKPGVKEVQKTQRQWFGVRRGDFKYVVNNTGVQQLFDVRNDPREQNDLLPRNPEEVARLHQVIDRWLTDMQLCASFFEAGGRSQMTAEDLETLRSLGYIRD